jgi:hypothetical protein
MRPSNAGAVALRLGLLFLGLAPSVLSLPLETNETHNELPYYRSPDLFGEDGLDKRADPRSFYLRIMPLGASIVRGWPMAPDDVNKEGNGFRKALRDKLRFDGWKVNMVGNYQEGKMADNVRNSDSRYWVVHKD